MYSSSGKRGKDVIFCTDFPISSVRWSGLIATVAPLRIDSNSSAGRMLSQLAMGKDTSAGVPLSIQRQMRRISWGLMSPASVMARRRRMRIKTSRGSWPLVAIMDCLNSAIMLSRTGRTCSPVWIDRQNTDRLVSPLYSLCESLDFSFVSVHKVQTLPTGCANNSSR